MSKTNGNSKNKPTPEAQAKAWSPEARAKAKATRARTMAAKKAAAEAAASILSPTHELSLDAIPDREPPRRKVKYEQGHVVSDDEWLFLQMAKRMLRGMR